MNNKYYELKTSLKKVPTQLNSRRIGHFAG